MQSIEIEQLARDFGARCDAHGFDLDEVLQAYKRSVDEPQGPKRGVFVAESVYFGLRLALALREH